MRKRKLFYVANDDIRVLSPLGEQGWDVITTTPFVVAKTFYMDADAPIVEQFRAWVERRINASEAERKELINRGYEFSSVYDDSIGKRRYEFVPKPGSPLLRWRLEINSSDDPSIAYITFGDIDFNSVAFCDKRIIDKYVPKDILEGALGCGAIKRKYMEVDDEA